jgi:ribonuclease HIII
MFMLDEVGQGDFFGTNYTAASSGVGTAEEQLTMNFNMRLMRL